MTPTTRGPLLRAVAIAAVLGALAWLLPQARHRVMHALTTYDAVPSEPIAFPDSPAGAPLPPAQRVRAILVDGLAAETARALPAWSAVCKRGTRLAVDVGFPTVSLPVEAALWSGLTQQQTGIVYRSDQPLATPLAGIPAQVPGSRAVAEDHGYIVRSLGFATVEPAAQPDAPAKDAEPQTWSGVWLAHAHDAVASDARLVFVHVLRVDTAGHRFGRDTPEYWTYAGTADALLDGLVATAPDARWFLLSDHGHIATGGHGGEERDVRHVEACIAGPGIAASPSAGAAPLVHVVDIARALADSTGATLDRASRARPLAVAMANPLAPDQAVPKLPVGASAIALVLLVLGSLATWWTARRWWLAPWWFAIGVLSLLVVRGEPTLSMPMVYAPSGRAMFLTWLPALAIAIVATWRGRSVTTLGRVVVAQLAAPIAALAAAITACGAWPVLAGADTAPAVPHITAWLSALMLIVAHGAAAVALAVLGRSVRSAFDRPSRAETPRTAI